MNDNKTIRFFRVSLNEHYPYQLTFIIDSPDGRVEDLLRYGVISDFEQVNLSIIAGSQNVLDWYTCAPNIPIVTKKMWHIIEPYVRDDVLEVFQCKVSDVDKEYFLLNLKAVDVLDEENSVIEYPSESELKRMHELREQLYYLPLPKYKYVWEAVVNAEKAKGHHLFREKYFPSKVMISEQLKQLIDEADVIGPGYTELRVAEKKKSIFAKLLGSKFIN